MDPRERAALFLADPTLFGEALQLALTQERKVWRKAEDHRVMSATQIATEWSYVDDELFCRFDMLRSSTLGEVAIESGNADIDPDLTLEQVQEKPVWTPFLGADLQDPNPERSEISAPCTFAEACAIVDARLTEEGWRFAPTEL